MWNEGKLFYLPLRVWASPLPLRPFPFYNCKEGQEPQLFGSAGLIKLQYLAEQMSSKCSVIFPNRKRAPGITNLEMPLEVL